MAGMSDLQNYRAASLLRHRNGCVVFAIGVWWIVGLTGIYVVGWHNLHTLIAGGFALRMIKVAHGADASRAFQEKVKERW